MIIHYECNKCKRHATNHQIDTMLCECGGDYRPGGIMFAKRYEFMSFYDPVLRTEVTSFNHQDKEMKKHRSYSHPEGLMRFSDDKKFQAECKYMHKHREEYKRATRQGYRPGDGHAWKPENPDAHHNRGRVVTYGR